MRATVEKDVWEFLRRSCLSQVDYIDTKYFDISLLYYYLNIDISHLLSFKMLAD